MAGQPLKRCPSPLHVGERELPFSEFHRCKSTKDGYKAWCKRCISAKYFADKSQQQARSRRWYQKNTELAKQRANDWYENNRERASERQKEYIRRNAEKVRARTRDWALRNRDKTREYARRQRERHPERIYERHRRWVADNKDRNSQHKKKYWAANPDVQRAANHRRRARLNAASGTVTKEQLRARWNYYNGKCWMCGNDATQMDHVKPIVNGGGSWASNLRPACKPCNSRKSGKWPFPTSVLSSPWSSD